VEILCYFSSDRASLDLAQELMQWWCPAEAIFSGKKGIRRWFFFTWVAVSLWRSSSEREQVFTSYLVSMKCNFQKGFIELKVSNYILSAVLIKFLF
jgi:hypothetical protein